MPLVCLIRCRKKKITTTTTTMSASATTGRKRTISQRVLENADPLVIKKKARVRIHAERKS